MMSTIGRQSTFVVILLLQLYGLSTIFIALVGNNENLTVAVDKGQKSPFEFHSAHKAQIVNKIVIVIIDAMRFDFIPHMDFVSKSLNENFTCLFHVNLDGPTVTLPRIKALVSGATSSYWEILTNLKQSSQMTLDNFIWRANSVGKQVVFYGDDTWLKLFPDNEFTRKEGVSSFFVTDFYEVDDNVTRNVDVEIGQQFNFDMMILHYLGVDHVGHVYGPKHSLIPLKLKEMDDIIGNIYEHLRLVESRLPHTILITGDHGMANLGGHGGDSISEVTTPLVVMTVNNINSKETKSVCKSNIGMDNAYKMKQVDIASTVSSLWGLPLPNNSRGVIPVEIISQLDLSSALPVLGSLATHLSNFLSEHKSSDITLLEDLIHLNQRYKELLNTVSSHSHRHEHEQRQLLEEYQSIVQKIRVAAIQESNQDVLTIISSIILLLETVLILVMSFSISSVHLILLAICCITSSITSLAPSPIVFLSVINLFFIVLQLRILKLNFCNIIQSCSDLTSVTIHLLNFLTPILYFSSSFVEEEHLPTYYLYATVVILSTTLLYPICVSKVETTVKLIVLLSIHRFCLGLNATGQKWNYLPDLNDSLSVNGLTDLLMISSFIVLTMCKVSSVFDRFCAITICCYKLNISSMIDNFGVSDQSQTDSSSHFEAKLCYLLIVASLLCSKWTTAPTVIPGKSKMMVENNPARTSFRMDNAWILLCCLLQRKENVVLIPLIHFQIKLIEEMTSEIFNKKKINVFVPLIHLLLFSTFFYQGNSNNITTIDISLGYTGLAVYNEYLVGILTFVGTFSLPILVIILSCNEAEESTVIPLLVGRIVFTNFIYSVVLYLMRQHLFIWSVFVPKLLYLLAFTLLTLLICLFDNLNYFL